MLDELLENIQRQSHDMRAGFGGLNHVQRPAHRGREHLRFEAVVPVNCKNVGEHFNARPADVVDAADERAHYVSAGFGGDDGLGRAEAERDIGANPVFGQRAGGNDAFGNQRNLDNNVAMNAGEEAAFGNHLFGGGGHYFGADIAIDNAGNAPDLIFNGRAF